MMLRSSLATMAVIFTCALSLAACNDSGFTGDNSKAKKPATEPAPSSGDVGNGQYKQVFSAASGRAVDVVLAVDTSGSMVEEMRYIESTMHDFLSQLTASLDSKVTVIGKASRKSPADPNDFFGSGAVFNFPKDLPTDRFGIVDRFIGSTDAIGILDQYFEGKLGFPLPLRDGVPVEIVAVTDDNGSNISPPLGGTPASGNTAAEFKGPQGKKWAYNGVIGLKKGRDPNNSACEITNVGEEHKKLATKTSGLIVDICTKDWNELVKKLSDSIIQRNAGFPLTHSPRTDQTIVVKVNGSQVDASYYVVDAANKLLTFKDTYTLPAGAQIEVTYYYQ